MRIHLIILGAVVGCLLTGCSEVVRVTQQDHTGKANTTRRLDGIPFYSMAARCKHETVWLEPTYQVSLVRTGSAKVGNEVKEFVLPVGSRLISWATYTSEKYRTVIRLLEEASSQQRDDQIVDAFRDLEQYVAEANKLPLPMNRILVLNQEAPEAFVNYADLQYCNARRPILGTVNAQVELSSNGTLAKGSAQIESKTLQAFLDLVPVKDVVSTAAKAALATGFDGGVQVVPVTLKLTVEPQIYRHTLSVAKSISTMCGTPDQPLVSIEKTNYSRVSVSDIAAKIICR